MSDGRALLQAILDDPDDDAVRLVYADWLEERGDPRAEFIRVGVQLAHLTRTAPRWRPLWVRELELIRTHKEVWFGAMRKRFSYWDCHRGFIDEVTADFTVLRETSEELFRSHPVQQLSVWQCTFDSVPWLLALPQLNRLSRLLLSTRYARAGTEGSVEAFQQIVEARPAGRQLNLHQLQPGYVHVAGTAPLAHFVIVLDRRPVPAANG
jgi:uncharacterized protein (TIGR02996 family)